MTLRFHMAGDALGSMKNHAHFSILSLEP